MLLKEFFDFDDPVYNELFCIVLYKIIKVYPNLKYLHELLNYKNINFPNLYNALETCYNSINKKKIVKTLNRSPHQLNTKAYLWPYYSLYFLLELYSKEVKEDKDIEKIIHLVFLYHYKYEMCINTNTEKLLYKLEQLSLSLTRVIEILYTIKLKASTKTYEKYFDTDNNDLFLHFCETIDQDEIKKFVVTRIKSKNYLRYLDDQNNYFDIDASRILHQSEQIIDMIIYRYNLYNDFITERLDISRQREKVERLRTIFSKNENANITHQKFVQARSINPQIFSKNRSEQIEQISKEIITYRDEGEAGNIYIQRLRNKAYSANVTKQNLVSTKHYNIPPLNLLKEFILELFEKDDDIGIDLSNEEKVVFNIIFIFGILTGQSYNRTVLILTEDFNDIKIKFDKQEMRTKINENLFASVKDTSFFEKKTQNVYFSLPYLLSLSLAQIKRILKKDTQKFLSTNMQNSYFKYLTKKMDLFYKTININLKRIDLLSQAYLTEAGFENISKMFCTAIYSQNDTAKMAYASIHQKADYFSDYILYLYEKLEIGSLLGKFLKTTMKESTKIVPSERIYAGSNLLVKQEKVRNFFNHLYELITFELNKNKKFNYISIYVRYAMSLLAATRTFKDSASLKDISYTFKVMKLSEKAETKLSGLRIIPLCDEILTLIRSYQNLCQQYNIDKTNFYLIINNKPVLLSPEIIQKNKIVDKNILNFIKNVPLNFGRHIFTKFSIEQAVPQDYIDAFLGHYTAGLEQVGIYSSLNIKKYIQKISSLTSRLAIMYGVKTL